MIGTENSMRGSGGMDRKDRRTHLEDSTPLKSPSHFFEPPHLIERIFFQGLSTCPGEPLAKSEGAAPVGGAAPPGIVVLGATMAPKAGNNFCFDQPAARRAKAHE